MYSNAIAEFTGLTWAALRQHFIDLPLERRGGAPDRILFRGQSSTKYGLDARFDRLTPSVTGEPKKRLYNEFIGHLRDSIETYNYVELSNFHRFSKIDQLLVIEMIGQHFGAPTRILDWTLSPYVATFFASFGPSATTDPNDSAAIWALDTEVLLERIGTDSCEVINILPSGLDRAIVQQARFTRNKSIYNDLTDLVIAAERESKSKFDEPVLYKFTISASEIAAARFDLSLMGIDQLRLFPGLESLCQSVAAKLMALVIS